MGLCCSSCCEPSNSVNVVDNPGPGFGPPPTHGVMVVDSPPDSHMARWSWLNVVYKVYLLN